MRGLALPVDQLIRPEAHSIAALGAGLFVNVVMAGTQAGVIHDIRVEEGRQPEGTMPGWPGKPKRDGELRHRHPIVGNNAGIEVPTEILEQLGSGKRPRVPVIAVGWFADSLGFATYHPEPGESLCC
jgi:hypothetical protein